MRLQFTRLAAIETRETRPCYENEQEGLGVRFMAELRGALARVKVPACVA